jgi:hypothetical protein
MPKTQRIRPNEEAELYDELRLLGANLWGEGLPQNSLDKDIILAPDYASYTDLLTGLIWGKRGGEWVLPSPAPPDPDKEYFFTYFGLTTPAQSSVGSTVAGEWDAFIIGDIFNPSALTADINNPDTDLSIVTTTPPAPCDFIGTESSKYTIVYRIKAAQITGTIPITFALINWRSGITPDPTFPMSQATYEATFWINSGESESTNVNGEWVGEITFNNEFYADDKFELICKTDTTDEPLLVIDSIEIDFRRFGPGL